MATKLSLLVRKNIKDFEDKGAWRRRCARQCSVLLLSSFAVAAALHQLQEASGLAGEVTFDCDYAAFGEHSWGSSDFSRQSQGAVVDKAGYTNRAGEYANDVLQGLLKNVQLHFKDETAKAAMQAAWTTGVVRLAVEAPRKGGPAYHDTAVANGDLVISLFQLGNISDIGGDLLGKLGDASGLSLKAALNWKKYEEERDALLVAIHEAAQLPSEVTLDVDQVAMSAFVDAAGYKDRVGEYTVDYLKAISNVMNRVYKPDELARTALQTAWTTGVLRIDIQKPKKGSNDYSETNVTNGDLVVTVYKLGNVSDAANDLQGKLTDASGLTLKAAQNWEKFAEERDKFLASIHEATQLAAEVTLDMDRVAVAAWVDAAGYKDRVGEYVVDYLKAVANVMNRVYKPDELARTSLQNAWTTGVLRLDLQKAKKGGPDYNETNIVNGDLVVTLYKLGNVSDAANDLQGKLTDASGLTLKAAQNWKKYEEEREALLQKLQSDAQLPADVTLELEQVPFAAFIDKAGYKDR
jgi:hypothetical protein